MASLPAEQHSTAHMQKMEAGKGAEVFVGGLTRGITEEKIQEVFSPCGEILEIRMIKDQKGHMRGFCFVRFATKEAAAKAVAEKTGVMIDGKKIGVLPSSEQDTLYFGNLNKAWTADEFERIVLQVFPDVESIDLAMHKDVSSDQKHRNRGFAFVKFSSHAAAARALRVGAQPDFRLGNLHPAIQWADQDTEVDPKELAKVKIAFVRNLPLDADEKYLKQMFEPYGKVEKVVVSKKRSGALGFIHFAERSDLEKAIKELNEKTVRGPKGGQMLKLEVEVAKPVDRNKKRARENSESKSSAQNQSKLLKEGPSVALPNNDNPRIQREFESSDPYEDAVIALPLAVKERLLRILRLGIATRCDLDVKSLCSLKELPESVAISILDQFMISGASLHDKGAYLAGLISRQVDRLGLGQALAGLPRVVDNIQTEARQYSFSRQVSPPPVGSFSSHPHSTMPRSENYVPNYSPLHPDYPLPGRMHTGRMDDKGSDFLLSTRPLPGSQGTQISRMAMLDERNHSPYEVAPGSSLSYGRQGPSHPYDVAPSLRNEERHLPPDLEAPIPPAYARRGPSHLSPAVEAPPPTSYARQGPSLSSDIPVVAGHQAPRPQIRFDPFTGEPYKFDPFTGEPILPETATRRF